MYLEVQRKINENEEKMHLEKEKEAVEEESFANKNKQGHRVYKRMCPSARKLSKGWK